METLSFTTIIWLLSLGACTGWLVGSFIGHEGSTLDSNIVWGMTSAMAIGFIFLLLDLGGVLLYAFIGTLSVLFLTNVFHFHHLEEVIEKNPRKTKRKL